MRTLRFSYFPFFFLALFLHSCSWQYVRFEAKFPTEISQKQNLVFRFSEKVASLRDIGKWDTTKYIQIFPAVRGQFKWTAPDEVVFSPEEPFEFGTEFTASPSPVLEKIIGKPFDPAAAVRFHTPYLEVKKVRHYWQMKDAKPKLVITLVFNDKVVPEAILSKLKVEQNGRKISFTQAEREKIEELTLRLNETPNLDKPLSILTPIESDKSKERRTEITLTAPDKLEVVDIATEGNNYNADVVRVYFNQELAEETATTYIDIPGEKDITMSAQKNVAEFAGYFSRSKLYTVQVKPGLTGLAGGMVSKPTAYEFTFQTENGTIRFAETESNIVTKGGHKNIGLNIRGIEEIEVSVYKIYDNNINRFDGEYGYSEYGDYQEHGTKIYSSTYRVASLPMKGKQRLLNLDFINEKTYGQGAYLLKVNSVDERYTGASRLITISNIGLVARKSKNAIWVWARSLETGEPLSGVKAKLIARNNQTIAEGTTSNDGHLLLNNTDWYSDDFRPMLLLASTASDFNFIKVDYEYLSGKRMETAGGWSGNEAKFMAFIYGDRNLYRPGETLHFQIVLRDQNKWQSPGKMPLIVTLSDAEGKEVNRSKLMSNEEGTASFDYAVPANANTGIYTLSVLSGTEVFLESKRVTVEEFQPEKLIVQVSLKEKQVKPGEDVHVSGKVKTYFGAVLADKELQGYVTFSRDVDVSSQNLNADPRYPFEFYMYPDEEDFGFEVKLKTLSDGSFNEAIRIPADLVWKGRFNANLQVTAFDESQRPVTRSVNFTVNTQPYLLGIRAKETGVSKDQPFYFELAALDEKNQPTKATAYVKVYRQEWINSYERNTEGNEYERIVSKQKLTLVNKAKVEFNGQKVFTVYPKQAGSHVVWVYASEKSTHYIQQNFYVNNYEVAGSWEADKAAGIKLELDKPSYNPGDQAELTLKTPFDGEVLLTWENDKVSEHRFVTAKNRMVTLDFQVKNHWLPNVYINAVLFRKYARASDGAPLTVGHGLANLKVNPVNHALDLTLQASEKLNTAQQIKVKVKTRPNAMVTLAAVDEAVLKMGNFGTPNPLGYFFQKRALGVESFDVFSRIFSEIQLPGYGVAGGGEAGAMMASLAKEEDMVGRQNPLADKLAPVYAHWSGSLQASKQGEIEFTFPATGFNGRVRVMAVGFQGNKFGSAESMVMTVDPVVVSLGLPPFLAPGDQLSCPLTIFNTEKEAVDVSLMFKTVNRLKVNDQGNITVKIQPKSEYQTTLTITADDALGDAAIQFDLKAGNFSGSPKAKSFIRPAVSLYKAASSGSLDQGQRKDLNFNYPFMAGTDTRYVLVSKLPTGRLANAYSLLNDMDYGCLEQTISMAFPLLYAENLTQLMPKKEGISPQTPQASAKLRIQEAIKKIQGKQLYTGSFLVWPYATTTYPWLDAYATHFLFEAKKAGYAVNASTINQALKACKTWSSELNPASQIRTVSVDPGLEVLEDEIALPKTTQTRIHSLVVPTARSYAQFVLALHGQANLSAMNADKARLNKLSPDGKALLSAAFAVMGDHASAQTVRNHAGNLSEKGKWRTDDFGSTLRSKAVELLARLENKTENNLLNSLADNLMNELNGTNWANSQELGFSLLALGKWMQVAQIGQGNAEVTSAGKSIGKIKDEFLLISKNLKDKTLTINSTGKSPVYYTMYQSGLPTTPVQKNEDKGLEVRRTYLDRNGKPLDINNLKVNDLVVVKLTLKTTGAPLIENVRVTDMLPACVEAENKNVSEVSQLPWAISAEAEHSETRIDRVQLFVSAGSKPKDFYYSARITHAGRFQVGPVAAEALYQRSNYSFNGGGTWVVKANRTAGI